MEDQQQKREVALTNSSENPIDASLVTNKGNNGDESMKNNDDAYFDSFPSGYRFKPSDEELVVHYLNKKVLNEPLPPNKIKDVILYQYDPEILTEEYSSPGQKEWYFFTPRERKYRNGNRPNRAAVDGYWKATGADKPIKSNGMDVGFKKALVFYKGKAPKGDKTDWIMHEYRVNNPLKRRTTGNDMRLDDWVLCRIYKKLDKSNKGLTRSRDNATQFQQAENGIPTQHQNNGCMLVDNSTMVPKAALMPKIFDMKSNYHYENQMGYVNAYGDGTSYKTSFHSYDPPMDQNSVFAQNIIPGYENRNAMVEPLSSKLPFHSMETPMNPELSLHSMETHMKPERFNEYHLDELFNLPPLENYDLLSNIDDFNQYVNMENSLPTNPMMMAPFNGDNCHR